MENRSSIQSNSNGSSASSQSPHRPISDSNDFVFLHSSPGESPPSIPNTDNEMCPNDLEAMYQKYKDKNIPPHINAMIDEALREDEPTPMDKLMKLILVESQDFHGRVHTTKELKDRARNLAAITNVSTIVDTITIATFVFFMFGGYLPGLIGSTVAFFGFQIASTACAKGIVTGGRWND